MDTQVTITLRATIRHASGRQDVASEAAHVAARLASRAAESLRDGCLVVGEVTTEVGP